MVVCVCGKIEFGDSGSQQSCENMNVLGSVSLLRKRLHLNLRMNRWFSRDVGRDENVIKHRHTGIDSDPDHLAGGIRAEQIARDRKGVWKNTEGI